MTKRIRNRGARRGTGVAMTAAANAFDIEAAAAPEIDPLEFSLRVMRDEQQPMALRASMAKAAMSAMKGMRADDSDDGGAPGGVPDPYPRLSSLELARRIALIFQRANEELRAAELAAEGWDVNVRGIPVDNTDWTRIVGRLAAILSSCHSPIESLDRAGLGV